MRTPSCALLTVVALATAACSESPGPRRALRGASPLVPIMREAAIEHDVPEELLGALAWSETALTDHSRHWDVDRDCDAHAPRSAGVMGLPEASTSRSVERAAALIGERTEAVVFDTRANVRGAAALLRELADETFGRGVLRANGDRDRWLEVVERWFDAGAAGRALALEVRRTIAQGLITADAEGRSFEILAFRELYALELPERYRTQQFAVAGEYPASTWVAASASNYTNGSRTAADIDVVVIHTAQGSYAGTISWFQNAAAQVSAHYVVRRSDGAVTQMLHHADIGWHAGNWNYNTRSIGIEHEGFIADANNYTDAMYQSSADLTRWLCDNLGIPKDRNHIIGHIEVPGATHTDPGPHWDWTRYMALVNQTGGTPMVGTGTLKGVVYIGMNSADRIAGAEVTVQPGGARATANSTGYFELALTPGDYTVSAAATGYTTGTVMRTITAGGETWSSVGLTPASQGTGTYRGVVYDARAPDLNTRLQGATVRLSSGDVVTTGADGAFVFTVAPGVYTAAAELSGWDPGSTTRTVVAGQIEWGSIGLVPSGTSTNRAPRVPLPESPIDGVSVVSIRPRFTVSDLVDPDGDPITLEVELYADQMLTERVSRVNVAVRTGSLVSWDHPGDDLPARETIFWRVRAGDGQQTSPWSTPQSFVTPGSEVARVPSTAVWTATPLPGVGLNAPPGAAAIRDPLDNAILGTTRPQILATGAADPEGDALSYQFQVASDDLFEAIETESPLVASQGELTGWVVGQQLAPGGRYYARARAADALLFGAWSPVVAFSIDPNAQTSGEERPQPPGGTKTLPEVTATISDEGCTAVGGPSGWAPIVVALALIALRRRAR